MAANYVVTHQEQTRILTPSGRFEDAMKIDFRTPAGVNGTVTMPFAQYNAKAVAEALEARVKAINEIGAL